MTVLITRPLAAAKRTEQAFQAIGVATWIDPVLTIIHLPAIINPAAYDAIITTSANGVESFAQLTQNRNIPIFCAGDASAAVACELGFTSIFYPAKSGGKELITLIKQIFQIKSPSLSSPKPNVLLSLPPPFLSSPGLTRGSKTIRPKNKHLDARIKSGHDTADNIKRFAYIRGEVVKINIADALANIEGMNIDTYITYKTVPTTGWTDETIALFHAKKITAITFYSEHSAQVTLDLLRKHNLLGFTPFITALCLSEAIAGVLKSFIWKNIKTENLGKF
ncbi:MAG: uroporphyrinogen-III synthase [Alphaproteobacteria bacterium]|nr:uroporphyrinogen-III synthase [Alphaproteobacteria bacterium]